MAGASIDMQVVADEVSAALAQLGAWSESDGDYQTWDAVGRFVADRTEERFDTSLDPTGTPWLPSQRAKRQGGKTLIDTNALLTSITHIARPDGVEVGTNTSYAAVHQFGHTFQREARTATVYFRPDREGNKGRFVKRRRAKFAQDVQIGAHTVTVPARPFLGLNDQDEAIVLEVLTARLLRLSGGA